MVTSFAADPVIKKGADGWKAWDIEGGASRRLDQFHIRHKGMEGRHDTIGIWQRTCVDPR